jgi:hypothetical protein
VDCYFEKSYAQAFADQAAKPFAKVQSLAAFGLRLG